MRLAATALVVGVLVGVSSALVSLLLRGVEWLAFGYIENGAVPGAEDAAPWRRLAAVVVAGVIAAFVWWMLRTRTRAVPSVVKAVAGEKMPWWQTIVHAALQIFIVGAGASIGREVAPRELGALIGGWFSDRLGFGAKDRTLIVAAAAGAGLAGVYNIPLAGALFAIEILLVDAAIDTVVFALGTAAVAALVASVVEGNDAFYNIHGATPSWSLAVCAAVFGPLFGLIGYLFAQSASVAEKRRASGTRILWLMPLMFLGVGVVAWVFPQVMGNGRAVAQAGFDATGFTYIGLLFALLLLKGVLTVGTIGSGASGGTLTPSLALGAAAGGIIGALWTLAWPGSSIAAFALVGAAAVLAASTKGPLMSIALVIELTHATLGFLAPVSIAVLGAVVVQRSLAARAASRPLPRRGADLY